MHQRKILITGALGGLGRELAFQLAGCEADLLLVDKNAHMLDLLSDEICGKGLNEPGVCAMNFANAGVADFESLAGILETQYGGLDILIHCAAVFEGLQPLDQIDARQWQECIQINLNSAWLATTCLLPLLKASRAGRVVFVHDSDQVSNSAYWGAYGVSKAALRSYSSILEQEFDGSPVDILNFSPGPMRTALRAKAFLAENPDAVQNPGDAAGKLIDLLNNSFV